MANRGNMRCPNCDQENAESSSFCIFCGADLRVGLAEEKAPEQEVPGQTSSEETSLDDLRDQVRKLHGVSLRLVQDIREIRASLTSHGMRLSERDLRELRQPLEPHAQREPASASEGAPGLKLQATGETVPASARARGAAPPAPMPWERIGVDWELVLGGNWLARIGVLAVVIGTAFFLKLAFDNDWIGETGRVALGIVGGVAFLGAGEYWQKRYTIYAQALTGGGIALLYLSFFAAFSLYGLIDFYPAIGLLLLVSVAAAALAIRYDSVALAIIGISGAFSAPFILGGFAQAAQEAEVTRAGGRVDLMAYVIVVDIGVLALSTFRNWRWLTTLALLASLAAFGSWYDDYGDAVGLLTSQGSLTIIFLIFVGATTLFHVIWRRTPNAFDYSLMLVNAAAYFGISYGLLWDDYRDWMGGFTLLLSLFYGGLAYLVLVRSRELVYLSYMALGIALVFLTIAVPVQLGGPWISVAWAIEALVLMWLSFRLGIVELRLFGMGVFAVMAVRLLFFDTPVELKDFRMVLNYRMLAFASGVAALYAAAYLVRRKQDMLQKDEKQALFPAFLVGASFLTLWVLSAEVIATVDSGIVDVSGRTADHVKSLSLSLLWAVYASILLVLGIIGRWQMVRLGALALLAIPILKLFLVDSFALERGYRVAAFLSLGGILLIGGYLYQRYSGVIKEFLFEQQKASPEA